MQTTLNMSQALSWHKSVLEMSSRIHLCLPLKGTQNISELQLGSKCRIRDGFANDAVTFLNSPKDGWEALDR